MPVSRPSKAEEADVDARFLLANERTLLAWLRTALSLEAAGVALIQLGRSRGAFLIGLALLAVGAAAAVTGYVRYRAADQNMRIGKLPPTGRGPALVTAGMVLLAGALLAFYLLR